MFQEYRRRFRIWYCVCVVADNNDYPTIPFESLLQCCLILIYATFNVRSGVAISFLLRVAKRKTLVLNNNKNRKNGFHAYTPSQYATYAFTKLGRICHVNEVLSEGKYLTQSQSEIPSKIEHKRWQVATTMLH